MTSPELHLPFRHVPRTGVIYVMTEATQRGFSYGDPAWANLGQGAPETGAIPDGPPRLSGITVDMHSTEYSPVPGRRDLREAVAALYNHRYRRGMKSQYTAENVAISGGGRLALSRIAAALGRTHVGHFIPDYTAYEELLELFEMFSTVPIPLDPERGYALGAAELRAELVDRGLGAVLFSNPSNPTGRLTSGEQLASWVHVAREVSSFLIIDEFYAHYVWDDAETGAGGVSAAAYVDDVNLDPVVIVDGMTKNWRYPGFRVGWTIGPKRVIEAVSSVGSFLDGGAPHPLQAAAIPLLEPGVADAEARAIRAHFRPKRDLMMRRLAQLGIRVEAPPAGAFYVWGAVDRLAVGINNGMDFFRNALERQVITVPGQFFDVNPGKRRHNSVSRFGNHLRFSFGPEISSLETGLDRLDEMVTAFASGAGGDT